MSTRPKVVRTRLLISSAVSGAVTSRAMSCGAEAPVAQISSDSVFRRSPRRATTASCTPSLASARAIPRPMPTLAPVTTATRPARSRFMPGLRAWRCLGDGWARGWSSWQPILRQTLHDLPAAVLCRGHEVRARPAGPRRPRRTRGTLPAWGCRGLGGSGAGDGHGVTDDECPHRLCGRLDDDDTLRGLELHQASAAVDLDHLADDPVLVTPGDGRFLEEPLGRRRGAPWCARPLRDGAGEREGCDRRDGQGRELRLHRMPPW